MATTERREINELLRGSDLLQRLFDSIQDGFLVVDVDGKIIYANTSAGRVIGIPREKLMHMKVDELPLAMIDPKGKETPATPRPFAVAIREDGQPGAQQVFLKRGDGSILPVLFNISATEKGPTVAILTDATDGLQRQTQAETYYQFLAHDIRTPLIVIKGYAEMLQSDSSEDTRNQCLSGIREASEQVVSFTAEMTDRLQAESGQLRLKKELADLGDLIREVATQLTFREANNRIKVQIPYLPEVKVDVARMKRVLANLITNALNYSPEDSIIRVSAWGNAKGIMVAINSKGAGIEAGNLNTIFDAFAVNRTGQETGSVGLGLYIVRLIVEAHSGRIFVSSTPGEETTFAIFLPKASI